MANPPNIHFIPYHRSPVETVAQHIVANATNLPDLTTIQVVLAESSGAADFRRALLTCAAAHNVHALLGPQVWSFTQWLHQYLPTDLAVCSQQQRLLILVDALFDQPALLGQANAWTLADSLLELFDELTLNHVRLDDDLEHFAQQLAQWYAVKRDDLQGLQHEARLLHGLWRAWHTQLQAQQLTDVTTAQSIALQRSLAQLDPQTTYHFIGLEPPHHAALDWTKQILAHNNVHLWWHGCIEKPNTPCRADASLISICSALELSPVGVTDSDAYRDAIASIYTDTPALHARARQLYEHYPHSPLQDRISIFSAMNAEQEANAIDIQCREWLLSGKQRIAIITDNRRQARRVRALLERAGIELQDAAGWALSTTRAAATIEALLLCIEEDFAHDALLDLCKSPYLFPDMDRDELKNLVYRLEHDIIRHEGISNGLKRYQAAVLDRAERLSTLWAFAPTRVTELLQRLNDACQPLLKLQHGSERRHALPAYLHALTQLLDNTGLSESLAQDAAGLLILQQIDAMQHAAESQSQLRQWRDFRAWLGRNLEKSYFRPPNQRSGVELLSLSQSQLRHFDGIIFASAEQEYLPGSPAGSPFFNDAVRSQLGLRTRQQFQQQRLRDFYRLLHSAPDILISHRAEQDGEPVTASPWLAALTTFHHIAYDNALPAQRLYALMRGGNTEVWRCDTTTLPERQTRPAPQVLADNIPATISASAYQNLLDCPYKFFAARCLKLSPPEEIREALSKREYGERVHLCLQAFHSDLPRYPGPFEQPINASNREQAIALLTQISEVVFARDLQDNYTHRAWYHQWLDTIPAYIDWQMDRNCSLQVALVEHYSESILSNHVNIKGRLDRIDQGEGGYAIIDYKSGQTPNQSDIRNGEKIQLPFYVLLAQAEDRPVIQVEYVQIGKSGECKSIFPQTGEPLQQLTQEVGDRLQNIMKQLTEGAGLPAWEDESTCQFCDDRHLCRVGGWQDDKGDAQ